MSADRKIISVSIRKGGERTMAQVIAQARYNVGMSDRSHAETTALARLQRQGERNTAFDRFMD